MAFKANAEYYDVVTDARKMQEMLAFSKGVRKVPVIVVGTKVSVGYGGT